MHLSQQEANQLECSIFHYFLWRQEGKQTDNERTTTDSKDGATASVDTTTHSPIDSALVDDCFKRIMQVLKENLPHVAMSETPAVSSSSTPEVCIRWLNYGRNIMVDTNKPVNKKRRRHIADEGNRSKKALKSSLEDGVTPEGANEILSTLRKALTESKKLTESLESKLSNSEKFSCELLRFQQEKLRLEKRLANLECDDTKTEQKLDDQQVMDKEDVEVNLSNLRTIIVEKKLKIELQESMFANAIVYEVHGKEQQIDANRLNWETRLQQLVEFKQEFGHCEVPNGWERNLGLYYWVKRQRQYFRRGNKILTPERIAKLDALGMAWDVDHFRTPRTFEARVEQCRTFLEAHGHLRIPLMTERNADGTEPSEDDVRFRLWSQSMRIQYHKIASGGKAKLEKHRIAILDSLGFQWNIDSTNVEGGNSSVENQTPEELQFRNRIEQLRKVKEICGNCNEKKNIVRVFPNNNSLYIWVKTQRQQMKYWLTGKKTRLTDERREMLRSIDFDHELRKHYTPTTSTKKKLTKMDKLALELKEKNNNPDSENAFEYDDIGFDM